MRVRLDLVEQAGLFEQGDDALAPLLARQTVKITRCRIGLRILRETGEEGRIVPQKQSRLGVEHVDERQVVAPADLEIVEVVSRRDLYGTRPLLRVGIAVGDDRNESPDQR